MTTLETLKAVAIWNQLDGQRGTIPESGARERRDTLKAAIARAEADAAVTAELLDSLDPDTLEAIAAEIDCFEHSARAHSLRVIANRQRAAIARAEGR